MQREFFLNQILQKADGSSPKSNFFEKSSPGPLQKTFKKKEIAVTHFCRDRRPRRSDTYGGIIRLWPYNILELDDDSSSSSFSLGEVHDHLICAQRIRALHTGSLREGAPAIAGEGECVKKQKSCTAVGFYCISARLCLRYKENEKKKERRKMKNPNRFRSLNDP